MFETTLNRLRNGRRADDGFTLIELLLVIIILGVLAAVVVFSVAGITDNSEEAACKTEVRTVDTAIEAYYVEEGSWPANLAALVSGDYLKDTPGYVTSIDADHNAVASC